jgi:hypothetical protein
MRVFFFILYAACSIHVFAQEKQLEQQIGWRGNRIEMHTISGKANQQSCSIIANDDSIRAFLINNEVQIVQQFSMPRLLEEQILGGFIKDSKVYLFIKSPQVNRLHTWILDSTAGTATENAVYCDLKEEKTINTISCGDRFIYFTLNRETAEFIIYDFTNERDFTILRQKLNEDMWKDLTKVSGLGRSVNVEAVYLEGECDVEVAAHTNKIYVRNDTLLLLMNKHRGSTTIFEFDLNNKQVHTRSITHGACDGGDNKAAAAENSFLLQHKLFYVCATNDSLCIRINDFTTGNLVASFATGKEGPISFANTPIIEEGVSVGPEHRVLYKNRQLLRRMLHGDAMIIPIPDNDQQIVLTAGSYKKAKPGNSPGIPVPIPAMGAFAGGIKFVPIGAVKRNNWGNWAYFKMLLNRNTFEHIDGKVPKSINEKIKYYSIGMHIIPGTENLFMTNGRYYYAYYDKKERKMKMVKF